MRCPCCWAFLISRGRARDGSAGSSGRLLPARVLVLVPVLGLVEAPRTERALVLGLWDLPSTKLHLPVATPRIGAQVHMHRRSRLQKPQKKEKDGSWSRVTSRDGGGRDGREPPRQPITIVPRPRRDGSVMSVESVASSRQGRKGRRRESRVRMDESASVARSRQGTKEHRRESPSTGFCLLEMCISRYTHTIRK